MLPGSSFSGSLKDTVRFPLGVNLSRPGSTTTLPITFASNAITTSFWSRNSPQISSLAAIATPSFSFISSKLLNLSLTCSVLTHSSSRLTSLSHSSTFISTSPNFFISFSIFSFSFSSTRSDLVFFFSTPTTSIVPARLSSSSSPLSLVITLGLAPPISSLPPLAILVGY